MKVYIKQRYISWNDKFDVYNKMGKSILKCKGDKGAVSSSFEVLKGRERIAEINEKVIKLRPKYEVCAAGISYEIVKKAAGIRDGFKVKELGWEITGNLKGHDYKIKGKYGKVAVISRKDFEKVNSYELDIEDEKDLIHVVCATIVIDAIMAEEEK